MAEEKSLVDIAQERMNADAKDWAISQIQRLLSKRNNLMRKVADINIEITNVKPEDYFKLKRLDDY